MCGDSTFLVNGNNWKFQDWGNSSAKVWIGLQLLSIYTPILLHITLSIIKSILNLWAIASPIGPNWVDPPLPLPISFSEDGASPVRGMCLSSYMDRIQILISNVIYHCQDFVESCYLYWPIALMLHLAL